jgi:hypothetical protein
VRSRDRRARPGTPEASVLTRSTAAGIVPRLPCAHPG